VGMGTEMELPWAGPEASKELKRGGMKTESIRKWLEMQHREGFAAKFLCDREGQPWKMRDYQRLSLESRDTRKLHCDGRDVGKTTEIEIITAWAMAACPEKEMMIACQTENQLFPLMHRLARRFETTPEFAPTLVELKRSPSWFFRFSNGFTLWGRIAGPRGTNFQGMHVDWQIVDEAQEMTETSWGELYQALNGGGMRWVYGVPNGLRNTFYRMSQMKNVDQYNWPSSENPDFTEEKEAELALLYGGRNAPGYVHRVLGQHGAPMHAVFSLDDYLDCVDDSLTDADVMLREGDAFAAPTDIRDGAYYLGCDLGYARDPSEFVVYRDEPPHLVNELRMHLEGVNYARQQAILEELDAAYHFRGIGIDCGNSGRSVAHQLMSLGEDWCEKVRAFEFGASMDVHTLADGTPARRRVKEFMTEVLQRRMAERTLVLPRIAERESQYASHTYSVNSLGQIIYEKGNDHIIDADRCALLRHYLDTQEDGPVSDIGVELRGF
jgi:hypothetical protein